MKYVHEGFMPAAYILNKCSWIKDEIALLTSGQELITGKWTDRDEAVLTLAMEAEGGQHGKLFS